MMRKLLPRLRWSWHTKVAETFFKVLSSALGLVMVSLCLPGQSLPQPSNPLERSPLRFDQPDLPDRGTPVGRRRGGTSRNDCLRQDKPSEGSKL